LGSFPLRGWLVSDIQPAWESKRACKFGNELCLTCRLEGETGCAEQVARFGNAKLVRWTAEPVTRPWQIEDAYCQIVEIEDSEWIAQVRRESPLYARVGRLKHYLVYVEDAGAYEIAAEAVIVEDLRPVGARPNGRDMQ